jgi:hypothetical protein
MNASPETADKPVSKRIQLRKNASGEARPSRPQRAAMSALRPFGARRAYLTWRLGGFVTNHHE